MDGKEHTTARGPFEPIGRPAPPLTITPCARCGIACMVRQQDDPPPAPTVTLRAATTTRGMCRECAAHWWLMSVDGIRWAVMQASDGFGMLAYSNVQIVLSAVLGMMHPELAGCDWARMLEQQDLPWPDDWRLPKDD